ncbi:hypothetical protein WA026_007739 [Henosepilachna vigintioctopunctata]|uniref:Sm domain-containing protein n=1 Tax=Henosepilachna vigintioctopunctata TaxID=420089 RepID=A0AAW1U505_9CUCU
MMHSSEDKFHMFNSMTGVVAGLESLYTTIDLRNEAIVTGKIVQVDGMMNIEMEDVTLYDAKGVEQTFPTFFVSARIIRHIHIPKGFSPQDLFDRQTKKMVKVKPKKVRTFKKNRAKKYNEEIVKEAYK